MKLVKKIATTVALVTPLISHGVELDSALTDWMSLVEDSTSITNLTIPGTHDSGALHEPISGTAKTQTLTITEQLNIGVRYLDIRLRHYEDSLVVHHGSVYQHLNFDDVLSSATAFLHDHPTETILMEVSEEYEAYNNSRSFEQTFVTYEQNPAYQPYWWTHSYVPSLGNVRGKIVLLRRYSGSFWTSGGIDITGWADNAEFDLYDTRNTRIHVQDYYKVNAVTNNNKWRSIQENLNAASAPTNQALFINFTSGYRAIFGIPNYPTVANDINERLINHFAEATPASHGIIVSDFASSELTEALIRNYLTSIR